MRVDDSTIEELSRNVNELLTINRRALEGVRDAETLKTEIRLLRSEADQLRSTIASVEYKSKVERGADLDRREADLKAAGDLAYNKGYAAAYVEVTGKMKS